ncbi:MAG: hypothetical protein HOE54_15455, partial [Gammaproteobacteria bacterium]|nr:hypothetical protein [Gammaproteobacteria bacterium]
GFEGSTMALDAACASGLYAVKTACDQLQDGSRDLMLAGGVNAADPLFIHMGFCALNALSKTGNSRPFHQDADGLIPSEGAAFVALKRLSDARADNDHIYGVIRGIGLSNDGRSGGFLSPSSDGQIQCMSSAYEMCDLAPDDVQFVECHATGTVAGDGAELTSLNKIFSKNDDLALGSLKANLGHLVTASGVAGLLKVLLSIEKGVIPGTPNSTPSIKAVSDSGFRVPADSEPWQPDVPRLAAVNSFGFGGNNAHLLVQEHDDKVNAETDAGNKPDPSFAIVNLGVRTGLDADTSAFSLRVCGADGGSSPAEDKIHLTAKSLAFPPADLKETLGQQLVLLHLLPELESGLASTDSARTGIFIGMQTDNEVCRYGLRWRLPELSQDYPAIDRLNLDEEVIPPLVAAGVLGKMPNLPANRISNQLDITGPGFTVSREELSGDAALELAMTAIQRGELDAAIVGAVDLANEQVQAEAVSRLQNVKGNNSSENRDTADAAVLLLIKSEAQAIADGDEILALIERSDPQAREENADDEVATQIDTGLKGAHAAEGLLNIATAVQRVRAGVSVSSPTKTRIQSAHCTIKNTSQFGETSSWRVHPSSGENVNKDVFGTLDLPQLETYSAKDRAALVEKIKAGTTGGRGKCRLALVGNPDELPQLREKAIQGISSETGLKSWSLQGISFSEAAIKGELAFAFTGAASAYPGMGNELFLSLPHLNRQLAERMPAAARAMQTAFDNDNGDHGLPFYQLAGSSYLCQLHARIGQDLLGLEPTVALGLSSGETNSMFAFGVWKEMDSLLEDIDETELYRSALSDRYTSVQEAWGMDEGEAVQWVSLRVLASVEDIARAIDEEPHAYLTIIQSDNDAVIGGDPGACEAVLAKLGNPETVPLNHDLAVHSPVVEPFEPVWRKLHTRRTSTTDGVRFYSSFHKGAYKPTRKSVADALTGQALETIDFRTIVESAWEDGVRVFVEQGPRNSLSSAIDSILGDRPHLAVSMDHSSVPSMTQLYRTAATLWSHGIGVDLSKLRCNLVNEEEAAPSASIAFDLRLAPIMAQRSSFQSTPEIYRPPAHQAGPAEGRLIPMAPALARTVPEVQGLQPPPIHHQVFKPTSSVIAVPEKPKPKSKPKPSPKSEDAVSPPSPGTTEIRRDEIPLAASGQIPSEHQLLINSHQQMRDAHESFLAAQLQGQQAFTQTMSRMQAVLFGADPNSADIATVLPDASISTAPLSGTDAPMTRTAELLTIPAVPLAEAAILPGPKFSREQLEVLAGGRISEVFGSLFEQQDEYAVQVRMPEPPLLLCDRVVGIEGEAGSMGLGTIWTETDVHEDSWYLHHGRMPPGIFIESGQADLLLISWLGIDFHNKGNRAYRLLGCELVFHGDLPKPGETLEYEIKVDGHAQQGDVRLFFFHYDCHINGEKRISVRNGQAGFFNIGELEDSAGVLWDAETADFTPEVEPGVAFAVCDKTSFSRNDIASYLGGDLQACFGDEFAWAHTHTRTPRSPEGSGNFLGEVTNFEPNGGPAGRGYMRIIEDVHPDDWFFDGHFKNDPCMPGTLMADACLQAMAFYMGARGHTLHKDGWRYQPVRDTGYKFVCRGQVIPESKQLVYEVFVDEEVVGNEPRLYAHVLCTVDGRKAFLCERLGLELVPDWPLTSMPELQDLSPDTRPLAHIGDFPLDYQSLISCALGQPSLAFGEGFAHYDGPLRSPRLPGPPYHFMTRIVALEGEMASMKSGGYVEALYDIPVDAWYFSDNGARTMPFCVLMEIALQPCGWLASYTLSRNYAESDLLFRNLDGTGTQHRDIVPGDGTLKTSVKLTSISVLGELIVENFEVSCTIDGEAVYTMKTVFGFFPPDAMENQKGLAISDHERHLLEQASNVTIDLESRPPEYFSHPTLHLPNSTLLMVDRITCLDPKGGEKGAGCIRGEKDVDITEWFFKSHFYQDPVQPGSLGIEAMLQVMQAYMISQGMHETFTCPRFEPILIEDETEWHYRGQVTPRKKLITVDFECLDLAVEQDQCWIKGSARLWADGLKIYHAPRIGMRIVEDPEGKYKQIESEVENSSTAQSVFDADGKASISLESSPWLGDHCPTYTIASVPMMNELELMAQFVLQQHPEKRILAVSRADAKSWLALGQPEVKIRAETVSTTDDTVDDTVDHTVKVQLFTENSDETQTLVASAQFHLGDTYPEPANPGIEPLQDGEALFDLYESSSLFHGPAFQLLSDLTLGTNGASGILDLDRNGVPAGELNPGVLDAALHCIPHDNMQHWCQNTLEDHAAYPLRIEALNLYRQMPTSGTLRVEARFVDIRARRFPCTHVYLLDGESLVADFRLTEVLMPKGPLGSLPPIERKTFFAGQAFVDAAAIGQRDGQRTRVNESDVAASNWLPGTLEQVYGADSESLVETIATSEHVGHELKLHPALVKMDAAGLCRNSPLNRFELSRRTDDQGCTVEGSPESIDWQFVRDYWVERSAGERHMINDLIISLIQKFVRRLILADPDNFEANIGRPVLYLGNHQMYVETFQFLSIVTVLSHTPTEAIAKKEHLGTWVANIFHLAEAEMPNTNPLQMLFFDREDPSDMFRILNDFSETLDDNPRSLLVHVDGTRAWQAGQPTLKVSSVLIDFAVNHNLPIVPLCFAGGLPLEPRKERLEFPVDYGRQDFYVGAGIEPAELKALPYAERAKRVLAAINSLGPGIYDQPIEADESFAELLGSTSGEKSETQQVLSSTLQMLPDMGKAMQTLLDKTASADYSKDELTPAERIATDLLGR